MKSEQNFFSWPVDTNQGTNLNIWKIWASKVRTYLKFNVLRYRFYSRLTSNLALRLEHNFFSSPVVTNQETQRQSFENSTTEKSLIFKSSVALGKIDNTWACQVSRALPSNRHFPILPSPCDGRQGIASHLALELHILVSENGHVLRFSNEKRLYCKKRKCADQRWGRKD